MRFSINNEAEMLPLAAAQKSGAASPLAYSPDHVPDELLFSWNARAHALNSRNNPRETLQALFGCSNTIPSADLPTRLGHFISQAAGGGVFATVEDVLNRATLFPYYAFFMSAERRAKAVEDMTADGGGRLKIAMGLVANGFGASTTLKGCDDCDGVSLAEHGCLIWSRSANLPSVHVCPVHGRPLRTVAVQSRQSNRHELLLPAGSSQGEVAPSATAATTASLLFLACLSREALNHAGPAPTPTLRRDAYLAGLHRLGLMSGSKIDWQELTRQIRERYAGFAGMPYRERLLSSASEPMRWARDLCQRPLRSFHPICHLLFIGTVFGSVASMLKTVADLRDRTPAKPSKPLSSASASAQHDEMVLKLLHDLRLSCREVAAKTGLAVTTIVVRRRALGLPISERRKSLTPKARREAEHLLARGMDVADVAARTRISLSQAYRLLASSSDLKLRHAAVAAEQERASRRKDWLALQRRHPALSVTEVRAKAPGIYAWLYRHDRSWLISERLKPSGAPSPKCRTRVDWAARDRELSAKARAAAAADQDQLNGGRRSITGLMRAIGKEASLRRNLYRLPELRRQLLLHSETRAQFRKRRNAAALDKLRSLGHQEPADWRVARAAGLRPKG